MLLLSLLVPPAPAQDYARLVTPTGHRFTAVWLGEGAAPVIVADGPGSPLGKPEDPPGVTPPMDSVTAVYVSTTGVLVTVFVDCAKRDAIECIEAFKRRYTLLTNLLPVDKEATAKYLAARRE